MSATATQLCVISTSSPTADIPSADFSNHSNAAGSPAPITAPADLNLICGSLLFGGITLAEALHVLRLARERSVAHRHALSNEGGPVCVVAMIAAGRMKVVQGGAEGGEAILRIAGPGDIANIPGVYSCDYESYRLQAMQPSRVLTWDLASFDSITQRYPVIQRNLITLMGAQLQAIEERFCEMVRLRVPTRVARTLARLCADYGVALREGMLIRFSREEIAQIAGTTMFAVSRLLSEWERLGLVKTMRQAIVVIDHQGLSDFTEAA